ncbi:MAG: hypothetical protein ABIR66_06535 [Saprospiraceae bacterium]
MRKYFPEGKPKAQPPSDRVILTGFFNTMPRAIGTTRSDGGREVSL